MAEEQSTLRDALNKITDWPGIAETVSSPRTDPVVNLGTTPTLYNDVVTTSPEVVAPVVAAAPVAAAVASAPVIEPYRGDAGDANYWLSITKGDLDFDFDTWNTNAQAKLQAEWDALSPRGQAIELANDQGTPMSYSNAVGQRAESYGNWKAGKPYEPYVPKKSSSSSSLRNPGPSAPWQESMQYWKDLEAQNK